MAISPPPRSWSTRFQECSTPRPDSTRCGTCRCRRFSPVANRCSYNPSHLFYLERSPGGARAFHLRFQPSAHPTRRSEGETGLTVATTSLPRLLVTDSQGGRMITVDKPVISLGRRTENDVCVIDAGVSRLHAEIVARNGEWSVRDCASKFGTFVNGERTT